MPQLSSVTIKRIKQGGYRAKAEGKCKCDNPYKCNPNKSMLWLSFFDEGDSNKYEAL